MVMPIDYTRTQEGDPATAAGLNDKFSDLEDALNDIDLPSIEREGLRYVHLPSLLPVVGISRFTTFAKAAPSIATPNAGETVAISNISQAGVFPGVTVTVTTATPHVFETGYRMDIAGTVNFNEGAAGPIVVTGANTFTYVSETDVSAAAAEVTGTAGGNTSYDRYNNSLPLSGGPAYPLTYQSFSTATPMGPGDSSSTGGPGKPAAQNTAETGGGWRILAYLSDSDNAARISLTVPSSITDLKIKGILVRGACELRNRRDGDATLGVPLVGDLASDPLRFAAIAIGWQSRDGDLHVVERSVRFYSTTAVQRGDMVTSTVLTQADLGDPLDADLDLGNVFVVIAGGRRGDVAQATQQQDLEVRYYNITVWPLHAGDL